MNDSLIQIKDSFMQNVTCLEKTQQGPEKLEFFSFHRDGKLVQKAPKCALSLRAAGSMRFRWDETNPKRDEFFNKLFSPGLSTGHFIVPVQLDHTHLVYDVKNADDSQNKIGDGIITANRNLVPTVTVADCMPLYLYEPETGVFGIVHSGWKGTGIVADAIKLAEKNYGAGAKNFLIVIGPHIRECCYIVNEERALWFRRNYTPECVTPLERGVEVSWNTGGGPLYRLSLEKANLAAIKKAGVPESNIWIHPACTCCTKNTSGEFIYGSNRRETAAAGKPDKFTVQAAFIFVN